MVADVIAETHESATLVLFTGNDALDYQPGHFLTIDPHQFDALDRWVSFLEDQKGKREPMRAYSISSAPHERHLAITVKEERYLRGITKYPPLLSPLLVKRTQRGMRMAVTGFTGPYTLPDDIEAQTDHLIHICAGSGIVPNYAMIKSCLHEGRKLRHTLVYSNKSWDDIIFRRQLAELEQRYPEQLRVVHTLTRDGEAAGRHLNVHAGRLSRERLRTVIPDPTAVVVMACGPAISRWDRERAQAAGEEPQPRFLESVMAHLKELGVPKDRIHHESYG